VGNARIQVDRYRDAVSVAAFRPSFAGTALLSDLRPITPHTPFGVAILHAREWPALTNSRISAERLALAKERARAASQPPIHSQRRLLVLGMLALSTLGALGVTIARKMGR
jgi:hypothetical protein